MFVLSEENQARFRMVRTGKIVNDRVEILSGLSGSETLVAGDLQDVHDGSPIQKNIKEGLPIEAHPWRRSNQTRRLSS